MIKDTELREREFREFPLIPKNALDQIEFDLLEQYLFYEKDRHNAHVYCTACRRGEYFTREKVIDGIYIGGSDVPDMLKHNQVGYCPMCHHKVTFKSEGRGHRKLSSRGNYCIFIAKDNKLYIHAVKAIIEWADIDAPDLSIYRFYRYAFTPEGAQRWKFKAYDYVWSESKSIGEPTFNLSGMWGYNTEDTTFYTCINEDDIDSTFLKYQEWGKYANKIKNPIKLLDFFCTHTKLSEELTKSGFMDIVLDHVDNSSNLNQYINFRAKAVKKALHFNAPEMRFWAKWDRHSDKSIHMLRYYICKKTIPDYKALLSLFDEYGSVEVMYICTIMQKAECSYKKVVNYLKKQDRNKEPYEFLQDFLDMHEMMNELNYPKDSCLRFPANMQQVHDRMVREYNENHDRMRLEEEKLKNAPLNEAIELQREYLEGFIYENYLYKIVLPESVEDIKEEGKVLDHCVASYAERHAKGMTHIFFIRKQWKPDERYYTIEVSKEGCIRQWYGYKDNRTIPKNFGVNQFVKEYQIFLNELFENKNKGVKKNERKKRNDHTDERLNA